MKYNNSNDKKIMKKQLKSGPGSLDQYYTTHKGTGLTYKDLNEKQVIFLSMELLHSVIKFHNKWSTQTQPSWMWEFDTTTPDTVELGLFRMTKHPRQGTLISHKQLDRLNSMNIHESVLGVNLPIITQWCKNNPTEHWSIKQQGSDDAGGLFYHAKKVRK